MIEVKNLTKKFGDFTAVDNVSFKVQRGEVLGFLGPNGAGKSTAMKMLSGFLAPTSGGALICGNDILSQSLQVRHQIGYLAENAPLYTDMTVGQFLRFIAEARSMTPTAIPAAIQKVVDSCVIADVFDQRIETLSKGYRRRVALGASLIHDPEVLILDEPTDGLDPNQKHHVRSLITSMGKEKAIILSTHILEEVEAVCSRVIIISRGQIKIDGTPKEIKLKDPKEGRLEVVFRHLTEGILS